MRTVLFVSYSIGIGGVEKALLGALDTFKSEWWDIHVALLKPEGELLKYIPNGISVHPIKGVEEVKPLLHTPMKQTIIKLLKLGKLSSAIQVGLCLLDCKLHKGFNRLYKYIYKDIPSFSEQEFDLAISFAGPDRILDSYVNYCVKAKEKWGWIHFDISKFGIDYSITNNVYQNFSRINIVSKQAKDIFDKEFPQLADKTIFTPNVINKDLIAKMSKENVGLPKRKDKQIILTVGRISAEKGQYNALQALNILVKNGRTDLCWWFVGDGNDSTRCKDYVREHNLEEFVKFFGAKVNPYPYMAACDTYVQPSLHEGFCITLAEAKLFNKPIIATDFSGAEEQLNTYTSPYRIVSNGIHEIAKAIETLL